ncbi:hypothetical protein OMZ99_001058 [Escherichia coli]|nr:hypothetical protein [Escherichia coli]HBD4590962.1 hypothetical protein [Shigella sonnei]HBD6759227.1 hypothetical protein [Shigella sonnei]HCM8577951.1 hypothetical protein [Shigella boydii]
MKTKIKTLIFAAAVALTGCTTTTPDFMKNAVVGVVDGSRTIVMYENPNGTYRPQFASDCPPILLGEDRPSTGSCEINANRITDIESYEVHKQHGSHSTMKRVSTNPSHIMMESINAPSIIPDNL